MNTLRVSPFGTDKTPMMAHAASQGEDIKELLCKLNDQGMAIVQVTHSEKNGSYGQMHRAAARRLDHEKRMIKQRIGDGRSTMIKRSVLDYPDAKYTYFGGSNLYFADPRLCISRYPVPSVGHR